MGTWSSSFPLGIRSRYIDIFEGRSLQFSGAWSSSAMIDIKPWLSAAATALSNPQFFMMNNPIDLE